MSLPVFQRTIVTEAGDVIAGAEVEVVNEATGLAADIFSNRDGSTPLTNPFFTGADGFAKFFAAPAEYRITATGPTGSIVFRFVVLTGDSARRDVGTGATQVPTNSDLGTMSTQNANAVAITGGSVSGASLTTSNATITGGSVSGISLSTPSDANFFGVTVGLGGGDIFTNTASGRNALRDNTTGNNNTAVGNNCLLNNTTGSFNTASGGLALQNNTTGNFNTATGRTVLFNNTTGDNNTAVGNNCLHENTIGTRNTATGTDTLRNNTTGSDNTASGRQVLRDNTTGIRNTASGLNALLNNTTGDNNTAIGIFALQDNTTGTNNLGLGASAGRPTSPFTVSTQDNRIVIGNNSHTDAYIRIAFTVTSDARDKAEISPVPLGLDFVNQLQPTEYQFKAGGRDGEPDGRRRYGFLAQDVLAAEGADPVIVDAEDDQNLKLHESYLVPVLVNAIKELTARIAELEKKS